MSKNLFVTDDGNTVEHFDIYDESISGHTIDGTEVRLNYTRDFAFRGNVGPREIYNLKRPAYRKGQPMTQEDLYVALDAAVSFDQAYTEHEARHGCEDASECPDFG